jgi:hypothetical protein
MPFKVAKVSQFPANVCYQHGFYATNYSLNNEQKASHIAHYRLYYSKIMRHVISHFVQSNVMFDSSMRVLNIMEKRV